LNWFGNYKLTVDGVVGSKTITAVEKFQKAVGIAVDGLFGKKALAKAKTVKK
jgi:peptidoglycan hydrolase-like protein with peptidoglycan-binding domain